jgi:ATP-binding cassette, subfamily A (ABC1), member 3
MLTLCIPIWLLLGIYVEAVAPREYGKPLKPWFMFLPSFWCPKKPEVKKDKQRKAWYLASVDETSSNVNLVSGISALQKN